MSSGIEALDPANKQRLLWLMAIGFFMQTLDATIMAASLGPPPRRYRGRDDRRPADKLQAG